eukprot:TRINITY_DN83309_c0_g1_i1.p1 TRINITY_DN83309_c0_g1~~TRINITY_DN83309_c0_g1_i1.p1  ORF type:complete len:211 (+),score=33.84 TRINITY_DN83309_c0_g1_i1:53-634(+)
MADGTYYCEGCGSERDFGEDMDCPSCGHAASNETYSFFDNYTLEQDGNLTEGYEACEFCTEGCKLCMSPQSSARKVPWVEPNILTELWPAGARRQGLKRPSMHGERQVSLQAPKSARRQSPNPSRVRRSEDVLLLRGQAPKRACHFKADRYAPSEFTFHSPMPCSVASHRADAHAIASKLLANYSYKEIPNAR